MTNIQDGRVRACVLSIAVIFAFGFGAACFERLSVQGRKASGATYSARRMADGKQWMTRNLNVAMPGSYCYGDSEGNCDQYGRLYTWESARRACQSLNDGWRLPTDGDWRLLASRYGGVSADSEDKGKAAYNALVTGGDSAFDAVLGGGRSEDGEYARLDAHGFYWTATEIDPANSWFYNFGKADKLCIGRTAARSREHSPFGA